MKNKILCLLFIQFIINSCSKPSPPKAVINLPYVISLEDSLLKIKHTKGVPPPPIPKYAYGGMNFILDDSNKVFFHGKHIYKLDGTGLDYSKPDILNLEPKDILQIDKSIIKQFIDDNTGYSRLGIHKFVVISSFSDTIKNPILETIIAYVKQNKGYYFIRKTTEEERSVLSNKKSLNGLF